MSRTVHQRSSRREHQARLCSCGRIDCWMERERIVRFGCADWRAVILLAPAAERARLAAWRRRRDTFVTKD